MTIHFYCTACKISPTRGVSELTRIPELGFKSRTVSTWAWDLKL